MRRARVVFSFTAGSILLTGMLAYSSSNPAICDSKATAAELGRLVASSKLPTPQSGLKLLMGILSRMGNEPQLAQMNKQQAKDTIAFQAQNLPQSQLFQNTTDPALIIRPQESSRSKTNYKNTGSIQGMNIAMAPSSEPTYANEASEQKAASAAEKGSTDKLSSASANGVWESDALKKGATQGLAGKQLKGASTTPVASFGRSDRASKEQERGLSPEATRRLSKDFGNLANIAAKMQEAQQMPSKMAYIPRPAQGFASGQAYGSGGGGASVLSEESPANNKTMFYKAPRNLQIIDERPLVRDFRSSGDSFSGNSSANRLIAHTPLPPARAAAMPGSYAAGDSADEGSAMKLDQPSAFKYNREYGQQSAVPADSDDAKEATHAHSKRKEANSEVAKAAPKMSFKKTMSKRDAESSSARQRLEVAFLPPSVVTGIPGLNLGSTESETNRFLANRGEVLKETITGWKIWSLRAPGSTEPTLQVYIKANQVHGLRIFDPALAPPGLGVSHGDGLVAMKEKFGEPNFILQESATNGGKNYVYVVSQVSFQLARTARTGDAPRVVSMLLFK